MSRLTFQLGKSVVVPNAASKRRVIAWRFCSFAEATLSMTKRQAERFTFEWRALDRVLATALIADQAIRPLPRARQMIRTVILPVVAAVALLGGCALVTPVPTTVDTPGMPNPEEALLQSIHHVDAEMAELGGLSAPVRVESNQPIVPEDLQRTVSFSWNGPLDKGVAKLAASIGYTFLTTGPSSQQPLDVAITISSVPVYQIFQALGAEAGAQATVQVDPQHHQVQVIHHV